MILEGDTRAGWIGPPLTFPLAWPRAQLLLLKPGGRVIYNGELGTGSSHLIDYFQSFSDVPK